MSNFIVGMNANLHALNVVHTTYRLFNLCNAKRRRTFASGCLNAYHRERPLAITRLTLQRRKINVVLLPVKKFVVMEVLHGI